MSKQDYTEQHSMPEWGNNRGCGDETQQDVLGRIEQLEAERERAVKACEQLRAQILTLKAGRWEAAEILKAARCPDCDGSGAIPYGDPNGDFEIEQCRWCYDRDETLAKIDAQQQENIDE